MKSILPRSANAQPKINLREGSNRNGHGKTIVNSIAGEIVFQTVLSLTTGKAVCKILHLDTRSPTEETSQIPSCAPSRAPKATNKPCG